MGSEQLLAPAPILFKPTIEFPICTKPGYAEWMPPVVMDPTAALFDTMVEL